MTMIENAKFRSPVRPGDLLDLQVTVVALDNATARVSARALVDGRVAASAQLVYVLVPLDRVVGARYVDFWRDLVRGLAAGLATALPPQPATDLPAEPATDVPAEAETGLPAVSP